jgi:hypothetical protein
MKISLLVPTVFLLSASAFAGCLDSTTDEVPPAGELSPLIDVSPSFLAVREAMAAVPCIDEASRTETTKNVLELNLDPVDQMAGPHAHAELDIHENMLLDTIHDAKGFVLVDISDPLDMKELGFLKDPRIQLPTRGSETTLDAKFSTNGENVYLAYSDAVAVADITDPTAPKLVETEMNPSGYTAQAHMIYPAKIGDAEYVFVFPSVSGIHAVVHKLAGSGPTAKLEYLTTYTYVSPMAPTAEPTAPHDGYVTWDPVVNHNLLYTANSFYGVQIMNVDDPAKPQTVATIPANPSGSPVGNAPTFYHTVQVGWIDGKRIIVTSAEVGYNTMKIFDATNFQSIKYLGEWVFDETNPTNMQHNLQIVNGTLFEAHYGQGLFGFDLASYVAKPSGEIPIIFHYQPPGSIWDVVLRKGLAYVSGPGVGVVGYGCFTPGDASLTSTG